MLTKHFLKGLVIFLGMIVLGLAGVFLVGYFDKTGHGGETASTGTDCGSADC